MQHSKSCLVERQVRADTEHFVLLFLEISLPVAKGRAHTGMDDDSAETLSHSFSLELFNSLAQHGVQINMLCLF